jgi:hypothetical protein
MFASEHDWQLQAQRSLARHVNLLLSTEFGGSPDDRPVVTPRTDAERSATGMTAPARGGTGNTVRDTLIRAGSTASPARQPRGTGTRIDGSTPPIVPSADPFDFPTTSAPPDWPLPPTVGATDANSSPSANARDPMPLWPDVPLETPGTVGPIRRSPRGAQTPRTEAVRRMPMPTVSASPGSVSVTCTFADQRSIRDAAIRAASRVIAEQVTQQITTRVVRPAAYYEAQRRASYR